MADTAEQRLNAHFKTVDGLSLKILLIKVVHHIYLKNPVDREGRRLAGSKVQQF